MKWRLTRPARPIDRPGTPRPTALVWVESDDEERDGPLRVESDDADLRAHLLDYIPRNCYGFRARILDEGMAPVDLACAMSGWQLARWGPAKEGE